MNDSACVAVYVQTEGTDHYLFCFPASCPEDVVEQLNKEMGTELAYVFQWIVTCSVNDSGYEKQVDDMIGKRIYEMQDELEDHND